jgi:hypothetical protein
MDDRLRAAKDKQQSRALERIPVNGYSRHNGGLNLDASQNSNNVRPRPVALPQFAPHGIFKALSSSGKGNAEIKTT